MNKLITLITGLFLIACGPSKEEIEKRNQLAGKVKYKVGDIVYVKPDSTKAVIVKQYTDLFEEHIMYEVKDGYNHYHGIPQELIYNQPINE